MTYYDTLEVTREADPAVIEKAYKALAAKHHPDHAGESERAGADQRMARLNEAYRVLRDPAARRRYDATLPRRHEHGWDIFMERGLVGLFLDRISHHG